MPREIVEHEEVTLAQVKKLLTQRKKDGELSFQQKITLEHASTFAKMTPSVSEKLVEKLIKKYSLSRSLAVQVVNIAPTTMEELKTILDPRNTDLTEEQLVEIVDLVLKGKS